MTQPFDASKPYTITMRVAAMKDIDRAAELVAAAGGVQGRGNCDVCGEEVVHDSTSSKPYLCHVCFMANGGFSMGNLKPTAAGKNLLDDMGLTEDEAILFASLEADFNPRWSKREMCSSTFNGVPCRYEAGHNLNDPRDSHESPEGHYPNISWDDSE